jgi:hypothetical protein
MLFYWGICILITFNGYARYTDETQHAAESVGTHEPGNALFQDGDNLIAQSLENVVSGNALSQDGGNLQRVPENNVMRRRYTEYGRADTFYCYGSSNRGAWVSYYHLNKKPLFAFARYSTASGIGRLQIYYKDESTGKYYSVGGGTGSGKYEHFNFRKFPERCIDRVDLHLARDSRKGYTLNRISFHGGSKSIWLGRSAGRYFKVLAPSGRCLGDVRMRTSQHGVNYLCLLFNAHKCPSKYGRNRRECEPEPNTSSKHGTSLKPKQCSRGEFRVGLYSCKRCRRCPYGYHVERACSKTQDTVCTSLKRKQCSYGEFRVGLYSCLRCRKCPYGYHVERACSKTRDTVCKRSVYCSWNQYRRNNRCYRCTKCPRGYMIVSRCTSTQDARCKRLPWGR